MSVSSFDRIGMDGPSVYRVFGEANHGAAVLFVGVVLVLGAARTYVVQRRSGGSVDPMLVGGLAILGIRHFYEVWDWAGNPPIKSIGNQVVDAAIAYQVLLLMRFVADWRRAEGRGSRESGGATSGRGGGEDGSHTLRAPVADAPSGG